MGMRYDIIDKGRLNEIVRTARLSGDISSDELGKMVSNLCKIVMITPLKDGKTFHMYTEDWQLEMFANASFAAIKAVKNIDMKDNAFNYLYTVIVNSYKNTLNYLYGLPVEMELGPLDFANVKNESVYVKEKRRLMRGIFAANEKKAMEAAISERKPRVQKVVKLAVKNFVNRLSGRKLEQLIRMARKTREALC